MTKNGRQNKKKNRIRKSATVLAVTIIALVVTYFLYDILMERLFPCRGIFQQTAPSVKVNMKIVQAKGEMFIRKEQIQELSKRAQEIALNLKTCCILLNRGLITSEEFLSCKQNAIDFERRIKSIANLLSEAQKAKQHDSPDVVKAKLDKISRVAIAAKNSSREFENQIKTPARRPEDEHKTAKSSPKPIRSEDLEPNNTYTQAMEIPMGVLTGNLGSDDEDYYRFEVANGNILNLAFTPSEQGGFLSISLKNFERETIWDHYKVAPGVTKSTREIMSSSSGGIYYVRIYGAEGRYQLELSTQSQNDADSGNDAGDEITKALEVNSEQFIRGELGGFDAEDWYKLSIPNGHILNLAFTPSEQGGFLSISLKNFERETVWDHYKVAPGVTKSTREIMSSSSGGIYYVRIYGAEGRYQLELSTQSQNDADSGNDAGDEITKALEVNSGQFIRGELGGFDKEDWYSFTPVEGQILTFSPAEEDGFLSIILKSFERETVWEYYNVAPGVTKSFTIPKVGMCPYFIRIYHGSGKYTLKIK